MKSIRITTSKKYGRQAVNVQTESTNQLGFNHYFDVTASTKRRLTKLFENHDFNHRVTVTEDDGVELEIWTKAAS